MLRALSRGNSNSLGDGGRETWTDGIRHHEGMRGVRIAGPEGEARGTQSRLQPMVTQERRESPTNVRFTTKGHHRFAGPGHELRQGRSWWVGAVLEVEGLLDEEKPSGTDQSNQRIGDRRRAASGRQQEAGVHDIKALRWQRRDPNVVDHRLRIDESVGGEQ